MTAGIGCDERRFVLRLLDYWQIVRGDREFPHPEEMDLSDCDLDMSSLAMVDVGFRPELSVFRFIGTQISPPGWGNGTGRQVRDIPVETPLFELFRHFSRITDRPVPMSFGEIFQIQGEPALGRTVLLPLSEDGVRITQVLGGISYRFQV